MEFIKIEDEVIYSKKKNKVRRNLEDLFIQSKCVQIEPSFFEDYEAFTAINKRIKKESMVKVLNGYGDVLILRPDITTSIIKSLIPRWERELKLKLFYDSTVFESKKNGDITEHRHVGVEYLGEEPISGDREVITLALEVLNQYNKKFILELGTSRFLNGLLSEMNLEHTEEKELRVLIYNKNQFEIKRFLGNIRSKKEIKDVLENILSFQGDFQSIISQVRNFYSNSEMKNGLEELKRLKEYIHTYGYQDNTHFDLSMVASLDYYQGIIFKGYYQKIYKPILSGGRYDALTERFGRKISAIGFSIDLNELIKTLYRGGDEIGIFDNSPCQGKIK